MKRLLAMFAFAALMLAGCREEQPELPSENGEKQPILEVGECATLPAEGGEFCVSFELKNGVEGVEPEVLCEAEWIHSFRFEEEWLYFTVDANSSEPGSEMRSAVVDVQYPEAATATFFVDQLATQLLTDCFELTLTKLYPDEVNYTLRVSDPGLTYLIGKISQAEVDAAADAQALAKSIVLSMVWSETGLESQLRQGDIDEGYFMFYPSELEQQNYLYAFGVTDEGAITTTILLQQLDLPPMPQLTIDTPSLSLGYEADTAEFGFAIDHPIEGEELEVTLDSSTSWIHDVEVGEGVVRFAYDANENPVKRVAQLRLNYRSAESCYVEVVQQMNLKSETNSFVIEVVECHWNRVIVNCIPSDPDAAYIIDSISEVNFEGEGWGCCEGDDANIPSTDLYNPYVLKVLRGPQEGYVVNNAIYSERLGWSFYVYAYGVELDANSYPVAATTEVAKVLVTLPDDRPIIEFEDVAESYGGEGEHVTIHYTIHNPLEGAVVKITNQHATMLSNLNDEREGEVSFTLGPNSSSATRRGVLLFEYFLPDYNEYVPVSTAELVITQLPL